MSDSDADSKKTQETTPEPLVTQDLFNVPPDIVSAKEGCYWNAEYHLDSARLLLEAGKHNAAYQHAVIALEEVGKAELLTMDWIARQHREEGYKNWMDDHLKKLFWSLWGPSFGKELITNEQIRTHQGLARRIHDTRLASLYVDVSGMQPTIMQLPEEETRSLVDLTSTRLSMSKEHHGSELASDRREILKWFIDAPNDPEKRRFIFGGASQRKLVELGDMWDWINWLHEECTASEAAAAEMLQQELNRQPPGEGEGEQPKWKIRFRLHCPSHSIRPRDLREWNEKYDWIKLISVKSRHEMLAEITLTKNFPIRAFWHMGLGIVRWFVTALNIGSFGFFWFSKAEYTGRFYESITDLESGTEISVEISPKLEFDWGNHALTGDLLASVSQCLVGMPRPNETDMLGPFNWYLTGISCLAKTDVHVPMVVEAFRGFYLAWKEGMIQYGEEDPSVDGPRLLAAQIAEMYPDEAEDQRNYEEFARGIETGNPDRENITLNEVGCMKVLCDYALLKFLRESAKEKLDAMDKDGQIA